MIINAQRLYRTFLRILPDYDRNPKFIEMFAFFCEALEIESEDAAINHRRKGTIHDSRIDRLIDPYAPVDEFEAADTSPICKFCGKVCQRAGICDDCGIG